MKSIVSSDNCGVGVGSGGGSDECGDDCGGGGGGMRGQCVQLKCLCTT